jgi:hypothetical protein
MTPPRWSLGDKCTMVIECAHMNARRGGGIAAFTL